MAIVSRPNRGEEARLDFETIFRDKIESISNTCEISMEDILRCKVDLDRHLWEGRVFYPAVGQFLKEIKLYLQNSAYGEGTAKNSFPTLPDFSDAPPQQPPGMVHRIDKYVARLKLSSHYNEATMGPVLNFVNQLRSAIEAAFPEFILTLIQGADHKVVELNFKKRGHAGVYIECRLYGEEFTFLAIDNTKPHIDARPLRDPKVPEIREYRMRWWDKGEPNGIWSPVQSIHVLP